MTRTRRDLHRVLLTATALLVGAGVVALLAVAFAPGATPPSANPAVVDARAFLDHYVKSDGRVYRPSNSDDTVSEGQAYGLLLAQVADRPATFARIWSWTAKHLQQPDGLLAWHASADGTVLNTEPASDADVLAAWTLARTRGPASAGYHADANRIAGAILAHETVLAPGGQLVLAAGPWATGSPASLDPSYWAQPAFATLETATGDQRWGALALGASTLSADITHDGAELPPDWAAIYGSDVTPEPAPNHGAPQTQYGLDAQRLVVWMAVSCNPADRALAAKWWKLLLKPDRQGAVALTPTGSVLDGAASPLGYVAAAAAAHAAGRQAAVQLLLRHATASQHDTPSYYGAAWLALGEALLTTSSLRATCADGAAA